MELGLQITLIGMGVVFATLVVLMGVVKVPLLVQRIAGNKGQELKPQPKQQPKQQPAAATPSEIPPQHVAVIAAAVAMLGQAYRVKTIEIIGNDNWERSRYTEITSL